MFAQKRKLLVTLFLSLVLICAAGVGAMGYLLLNAPTKNIIRAVGEPFHIVYHSVEGTDGTKTEHDSGVAYEAYSMESSGIFWATFSATGFNRYGYTFDGWAPEPNKTEPTDHSYNLTPDYKGGLNLDVGKIVGLLQVLPGGKTLAEYITDGFLHVYAMWSPKTYTVKFDAGMMGGGGNPEFGTGGQYADDNNIPYIKTIYNVKYGDEIYLTDDSDRYLEPTADDPYEFAGWFVDYDDNDPNYTGIRRMKGTRLITFTDNKTPERGKSRSPFDTLEDDSITLYANWNTGAYRLNYILNGPENPNPTITVVSKNDTTHPLYHQAWDNGGNGEIINTHYGPREEYIRDQKTGEWVLAVDPSFPNYQEPMNMIALNAPYTILPDSPYTIKGYTFAGWYFNIDNGVDDDCYTDGVPLENLDSDPNIDGIQVINLLTVKYTDGGTTEAEGVKRIYAKWVKNTYTIKYEMGSFNAKFKDGVLKEAPTQLAVEYDTELKLWSNDYYESTGYKFVGWTTYFGTAGDGFVVGRTDVLDNFKGAQRIYRPGGEIEVQKLMQMSFPMGTTVI